MMAFMVWSRGSVGITRSARNCVSPLSCAGNYVSWKHLLLSSVLNTIHLCVFSVSYVSSS